MATAWELVTISTWWWESDFELVRGDGKPPFLSKESRWPLTTMGLIESLKPFGVNFKILVNQFLSQDGLLSQVNIDDLLLGAVANGDVEYMGQYNDASGKFTISLSDIDLETRLESSGIKNDGVAVDKMLLKAPVPPQNVDMTDLPLGLDAVELPHASWHQKFFTSDQSVAYIGGINFDVLDWDSGDMHVFDPRRMPFEATVSARQKVADKEEPSEYPTRRDYMLRAEGPIVVDAMEVFHTRWHDLMASEVAYSDSASSFGLLEAPDPIGDGVRAQVVTTMPAPYERYEIMESLLRAIGQAEDYILIEDQYFRAPILGDAIAKRLVEAPELVVIAVINPISEWADPGCWQTLIELNQLKDAGGARFGVFRLRSFDSYDSGCFFCWDETVGVFSDTFIHSKLVIIDDIYFQMGSANHNNRGLLFEGEMATVVVDDGWVTAARHDVASALLGASYNQNSDGLGLLQQFVAQSASNESVYEAWQDEGMDIDLDGDPLPSTYKPKGYIYPIPFNVPDECLIEGVGKDIM